MSVTVYLGAIKRGYDGAHEGELGTRGGFMDEMGEEESSLT